MIFNRAKSQLDFLVKFSYLPIIFVAFLAIFFSPLSVLAASAPTIISYQGRLADIDGNVLGGTGTNYYFKVSFWSSATVGSGSQVWPTASPTAFTSMVRHGLFNINIGEAGYPGTLNYDFSSNSDIYLQIEVSYNGSSYETMSPRQPLNSAPYAILAGSVSGTGTSTMGALQVNGNSTTTGVSYLGAMTGLNNQYISAWSDLTTYLPTVTGWDTGSDNLNWDTKFSTAIVPYSTQAYNSSTFFTLAGWYSTSSQFLTTTTAASTYLTQASSTATYLTISNAASIYLSAANAALTYQTLAGDIAFSTSSADYWGSTKGYLTTDVQFSSTSADYWDTTKNRWTSANATSSFNTLIVSSLAPYSTQAYNSSTFLTVESDPVWIASSSDYLKVSTAASTYTTQASSTATYLTIATAASTYLTSSNAATTYLGLADWYSTTTKANLVITKSQVSDFGSPLYSFTESDPVYALTSSTILRVGTSTDVLTEGLVNKFYTDGKVATYINSSTTIPKGSCNSGEILKWNGSSWLCSADDTLAGGETDPVFNASFAKGITSSTNWDLAYSWGNHANFSYLTQANAALTYQTLAGDIAFSTSSADYWDATKNRWTSANATSSFNTLIISSLAPYSTQAYNSSTFLTSFTESDPVFMAASTSLAYQPVGSYLTVESDPVWIASSSDYLKVSTAASTYTTQASSTATYLTISNAASTYLTSSNAATTYLGLTDWYSTTTKANLVITKSQVSDFGSPLYSFTESDPVFMAASTSLAYQPVGSYLTVESDPVWMAASTSYLTVASSTATYLTIASASNTYLTSANAALTYQTLAGDIAFSTSSADYWGSTKGYLTTDVQFSSTSADYWDTTKNRWTSANATSSFNTLIVSSLAPYSTQAYNSSTFLTVESDPVWMAASTSYLTVASSTATYLTISNAASTYQPIGSYLTSYTESDPVWIASSSDYLKVATAATTYTTQASSTATYLTINNAASTYLTSSNAATTYLGLTDWYSTTTKANLVITKSQVSDFGSYENPLTFTYPLQRTVDAISLAFGTTTENTWSAHNIFSSLFVTDTSSTNATTTNLSVNSNAYFPLGIWNSSGNVGINDTTPDYTLDVEGTFGAATSTIIGELYNQPNPDTGGSGSPNNGRNLFLQSFAPNLYFNDRTVNESDYMINVNTGVFTINQASSTDLTSFTTIFAIDASGEVGIGTTAPGSPLHVVADTSNNNIRLEENSGGEYNTLSTQADGALRIVSDTSAARYFEFTDALVGFNHIYEGGISQSFMKTYSDTTTHRPVFHLAHNGGSLATPSMTVDGSTLGQIYFDGYGVNAESTGLATISAETDGEWGTGADTSDSPTKLEFATTPDGSSLSATRMTIASTGNVGIGTTTPQARLHIGTSFVDTDFFAANAGAIIADGVNSSLVVQGSGTGNLILVDSGAGADDKAILLRTDSGITQFLSVADNGAAQVENILVLDHLSGYVGIGTTTPSTKLSIYQGALNFSEASQQAYLGIVDRLGITPSGGPGSADFYLAGGTANDFYITSQSNSTGEGLHFGNSYNSGDITPFTEYMTILGAGTGAGNVGIGTTTPNALFQVGNATEFFKTDSGNATTTGYMTIGAAPTRANFTAGSLNVGGAGVFGSTVSSTGFRTTGTIIASPTNDIGWTVVAGTNMTCNTSCNSGCVFGLASGGTSDGTAVACSAATSEYCICAGP